MKPSKPERDEPEAGPDPVFRNTFVCFQLAIAEDARVMGGWLDEVMAEAYVLGNGYSGRTALRGTALDLLHLDRFFAAARLDMTEVQREIRGFVQLIEEALEEDVRPERQTPAFRETFLLRLPLEPQRAARSLGVYLHGTLAEAKAERCPREARQGVVGELSYLAAHLREEPVRDLAESGLPEEHRRLARFAGRMAGRLAALARTAEGQKPVRQTSSTLLGETG